MYIAGVVEDGRFSAQMITDKTQIVFIDEWNSNSLSCDEAKKLLQGKFYWCILTHKDLSTFRFLVLVDLLLCLPSND